MPVILPLFIDAALCSFEAEWYAEDFAMKAGHTVQGSRLGMPHESLQNAGFCF